MNVKIFDQTFSPKLHAIFVQRSGHQTFLIGFLTHTCLSMQHYMYNWTQYVMFFIKHMQSNESGMELFKYINRCSNIGANILIALNRWEHHTNG